MVIHNVDYNRDNIKSSNIGAIGGGVQKFDWHTKAGLLCFTDALRLTLTEKNGSIA